MSGEKLDFSKPEELQTRDGRQVRIYATDGGGSHCVHGALLANDGWVIAKWMVSGRNHNSVYDSPYDIVRKTARIKGWFNVEADGVWYMKHPTLEAAREYVAKGTQSCAGQIYIDAEVQT